MLPFLLGLAVGLVIGGFYLRPALIESYEDIIDEKDEEIQKLKERRTTESYKK